MTIEKALNLTDVIKHFRETSPDHIVEAVDLFMRTTRREQLEVIAYQLQHMMHGIDVVARLATHVHGLVCPHAEDASHDIIEMASDDMDGKATNAVSTLKQ